MLPNGVRAGAEVAVPRPTSHSPAPTSTSQ
jgi:hypothetical protein